MFLAASFAWRGGQAEHSAETRDAGEGDIPDPRNQVSNGLLCNTPGRGRRQEFWYGEGLICVRQRGEGRGNAYFKGWTKSGEEASRRYWFGLRPAVQQRKRTNQFGERGNLLQYTKHDILY